jgi:hypothetical protein
MPSVPETKSRPLREPLGALGLVKDADSFLQIALVRLDLLFERDPLKRKELEGREHLLEEVEGMDWPPPATATAARAFAREPDRAEAMGGALDLAFGDITALHRIRATGGIRSSGSRRIAGA